MSLCPDDDLPDRAFEIMQVGRTMRPDDFLDALIIASVATIASCWPAFAHDAVVRAYLARVREVMRDMTEERPLQ